MIRFRVRTNRAESRRNPLFITAVLTVRFRKSAMMPVSLPDVVLARCLMIPDLCTRPFSTSTLTSGAVKGIRAFIMTAMTTGNRTWACRSTLCESHGTWTVCLPWAASSCTTGGTTTGISDTQSQVVMATGVISLGVSPPDMQTDAGLLTVLTTLTEVVRPRSNLSIRVRTRARKTLNRLVVLSSITCGPLSRGLKLATVLTFMKTSSGNSLPVMFTPHSMASVFLGLISGDRGTPVSIVLVLTGTSSSGLHLPMTVS